MKTELIFFLISFLLVSCSSLLTKGGDKITVVKDGNILPKDCKRIGQVRGRHEHNAWGSSSSLVSALNAARNLAGNNPEVDTLVIAHSDSGNWGAEVRGFTYKCNVD